MTASTSTRESILCVLLVGGLAQVVTDSGVVLGDSDYSIPWVPFPDEWVAAARHANTSIDWRKHNAVTPTKKQCGGTCGTYSFLENAESQYAIHTGNLSIMSDAQVLHCHNDSSLFDELIILGAESAAEYPRDCNLSSPCLFDPSKVLYRGWTATTECPSGPTGGEDQVAAWVLRNGPVSTAIQAEIFLQRDLANFVTADRCHVLPGGTDHAVNIVGFGTDDQKGPYWIIRNSWGPAWGAGGFALVSRGSLLNGALFAPGCGKCCDHGVIITYGPDPQAAYWPYGPPAPPNCSAAQWEEGVSYYGGSGALGSAPGASPGDCCGQCTNATWAARGCLYFTFNTQQNLCWFLAGDSARHAHKDVTSGRARGLPPPPQPPPSPSATPTPTTRQPGPCMAAPIAGGGGGGAAATPALGFQPCYAKAASQVWDWSGALNRTGPVKLRGAPADLCLEPAPQPLVAPPQCSAAAPGECWADAPELNATFWTQSPAACCYACQLGRLSNDVDGLPLCARWSLVNSTCRLYGAGGSNATLPCPGAVAGLRAPASGGAALPAPHQFAGGALRAAPCDGSPAQDWLYTGIPTTNATDSLLYGLVQHAGSGGGMCFSLSPDEGFRVGLDACEPPQRGRQTPQSILYNASSGAAMSRAASATLHTPPWCLAACAEE